MKKSRMVVGKSEHGRGVIWPLKILLYLKRNRLDYWPLFRKGACFSRAEMKPKKRNNVFYYHFFDDVLKDTLRAKIETFRHEHHKLNQNH